MAKLRIIYEPQGPAAEYVPGGLACNHLIGCSHGCRYCYAPGVLHRKREDFMGHPALAKDAPAKIARDAEDLQAAGDTRMTLFSFVADPYPNHEPAFWPFTRAALAIMGAWVRPFTVLTKNPFVAIHDELLFTPGRDVLATSIVFTDEADRENWEPNAPDLESRWLGLFLADCYGLETWISVEPVIDPAQALDVIRRAAAEGIGHVKVGPLNHHPLAKTVDWRAFGEDLAGVLEETGIDYYLKHDLRPYMPEGFACSTIETEEAGI